MYQCVCYEYPCSGDTTYIGYTTTPLNTQLLNHTQQGSVKMHNANVNQCKTTTRELLTCTKIFAPVNNKTDLFTVEAMFIRHEA